MRTAVHAGVLYGGIVFGVGVVLGTLRILLLVPRFGESAAVLIELPVMLALSWAVCGWLLRRRAVPADAPARLAMGAVAFAVLMSAEVALALTLMRQSLATFLAGFTEAKGALGLAGQLAFALFPLLHRRAS